MAGLGSRFLAALLDTTIQLALIIALFTLAGLGAGANRWWPSSETAGLVLIAVLIVILFLITWGYFIFFELAWNGQTPGKRVVGIRVLTTGGQPIGLTHSLIRNLLRIVDFLPSSYMLGAVVILVTRRSQRLGDLAAGTMAVKEHREAAPRLLSEGAVAPLPALESSAFNADDIALAREFLLRRAELATKRRQELAERIAGQFRPRLGPDAAREPAETLLARVAAIRR